MEAATIFGAYGRLRYVPSAELARIRGLGADPVARAAAFADACRINTLSMIMEAGSGHIGTSFSVMEVLAWLRLEVLQGDDVCFSSKGHDAPAMYATLIGVGALPFELIHRLRRLGGLPGHPDVHATPQLHTNTGSLGMGISKAKGFARAARLDGGRRRVFVITGDGELQEGQFWEALGQAANEGFGEITAIVDHNKLQSDTWVSEVSDLGDLAAKVRAFGWEVGRCDGNDVGAVAAELEALAQRAPERPKLLIADTRKGAGASVFEPHDLERSATALYRYHSGAPSPDDYGRALRELETRLARRVEALDGAPVELIHVDPPRRRPPQRAQMLVAAYGDALAEEAAADPRLIGLDADLSVDTGLTAFRARLPERFVECGIAEQDMVSQAGALALAGKLPVVHSFACFLVPRANEQIYNNATEGTKVIYVGSLAGLVPGGPGHSHQSVRDIALMGCVPGMSLIEPATEDEAAAAVRWAVRASTGPVYIRLVSVPWELGFEPPPAEALVHGRGTVLREGADALIVTTGPVMLSQAWAAADRLAAERVACGVVSLPWLRDVDGDWLAEVAAGAPVFTLDNHCVSGGQGEAVRGALAAACYPEVGRAFSLGVERTPSCGSNEEVLKAHQLDAEAIAERIAHSLRVVA